MSGWEEPEKELFLRRDGLVRGMSDHRSKAMRSQRHRTSPKEFCKTRVGGESYAALLDNTEAVVKNVRNASLSAAVAWARSVPS